MKRTRNDGSGMPRMVDAQLVKGITNAVTLAIETVVCTYALFVDMHKAPMLDYGKRREEAEKLE
eukprot:3913611-Prorocentrum_lima.AAC.1